jgi:hypothetical protein
MSSHDGMRQTDELRDSEIMEIRGRCLIEQGCGLVLAARVLRANTDYLKRDRHPVGHG